MTLLLHILLSSAFGALIGYTANRLAIWMLFHPADPVKVGPVTLQGVIPKRRRELIERTAEVTSRRILSDKDILEAIRRAQEEAIRDALEEKLAALPVVGKVLSRLAASASSAAASKVVKWMEGRIDVRSLISRKMSEVSSRELDTIFKEVIGRELVYISLNDAAIGAIVGAVEALVLSAL
ncbi:MAG: hypothetical protein DRN99_08570 [Thermoproteota archaeon]|nr:MAG: hypothetical protein DRN99_08570 [Candidatus Korarchaeota archaeon]